MKDLVFYLILFIILYLVLTNLIDAKEKYYNSSNSSHAWYTSDGNTGTKLMEVDSNGTLTVKRDIISQNSDGPRVNFPGTSALALTKRAVSSSVERRTQRIPEPSTDPSRWDQHVYAFLQGKTFSIGKAWFDISDMIHSKKYLNLASSGIISTNNDFGVGQLMVLKDIHIPNGNLILNDTTCIRAHDDGSIFITEYKVRTGEGVNKTCGAATTANKLDINRH
jgi:hypothetical protein